MKNSLKVLMIIQPHQIQTMKFHLALMQAMESNIACSLKAYVDWVTKSHQSQLVKTHNTQMVKSLQVVVMKS